MSGLPQSTALLAAIGRMFQRRKKNFRTVMSSAQTLAATAAYSPSVESGGRVMIVEDDPTVRTVVADYLRAHGFDVTQFADGAAAWAALQGQSPDVLVVDRMMPGMSGTELCQQVRQISDVPILMLTALGSVEDRIEGLEHGADDYLAKPFSMRELQLRIAALVRRRIADSAPLDFTAGSFRVDPAHRRVWLRDKEISLTTREYELFLFLVRNDGRVVSRDEILRDVWGWGFGDATTVTVHVRRLREKIETDARFPSFLHTEWGAGYRFTASAPC